MFAKRFPYPAFPRVADDGIPDAAGDRKAQSNGVGLSIGRANDALDD